MTAAAASSSLRRLEVPDVSHTAVAFHSLLEMVMTYKNMLSHPSNIYSSRLVNTTFFETYFYYRLANHRQSRDADRGPGARAEDGCRMCFDFFVDYLPHVHEDSKGK